MLSYSTRPKMRSEDIKIKPKNKTITKPQVCRLYASSFKRKQMTKQISQACLRTVI